ncbi:hypothetical protein C2845_PM10G21970 [Panicum miliaceum]|uniref:DUF4378 domain-containing protein n=1 Tax=Panicum miliaceum TaxID=4540 RepID=A0A3L6PHK4_PANMI|nr:hypothetical protein C2845_PM10G21970 [Panicum miliaceum]
MVRKPLFGLPKVKRDGNMAKILQEVKEMLQKELKANDTTELNTVTCWGTEATQISRDIAKQTKETVTKDHGKRLFRSESFRGFRSDRKRKEATTKNASPEHANLTELPPSPVSPLEVVGHSCRHFFNDLNCTLPELNPKCLSEFEAPASELSYRTEITVETACNLDKAYVREILVAAGLYDDGSLDNKGSARVDSMARPICDDIFEEVEDIYYYRGKYCDDGIAMYSDAGGNATDHRMLFALPTKHCRAWCRVRKPVPRCGNGSLTVLLCFSQISGANAKEPPNAGMQTIDSMVAYEIRNSAWAEVLYEDAYVVGRKIERAIFDELIEDLLIEVFI